MTGSVRPRTASLVAGCVGALALTTALSACASSTTTGAGGGASAVVSVSSPSAAASSPAATTSSPAGAIQPAQSTASASAGGGGTVNSPKQVLAGPPAGAKLVPFDGATASADGRTVYVELESMGGPCGQYDVVLQQSSTAVKVGLVHVNSGGHVCPQFVGPMRIAVSLAAPIAHRPVVDLADGQSLNVG